MSRISRSFVNDLLLPLAWGGFFIGVIFSAAVRTDLIGQWWLAGLVLLCLFVMRRMPLRDIGRVVFLLLGTYLTARYFFWRTFTTLSYYDFFSYIGAILLYLAELFGITLYLLSIFVNIQPLRRAVTPLPADPRLLPSVDVLVPSYNEPPDMLEVTLLAALMVRYPKDKLRVYLLDDGGTLEKRNAADPALAAAALLRHQTLRAMCERVGAHYLTREKNEHAKAGNLNAGLKATHGELVLILDADHVATMDFLEKTVGMFAHDDNLCLVQTPHFFINPDPIEKQNLKIFGRMPSENEMFYSSIQHGLDFWNSSFFCGSAAVLRRKHLEAIGGICCSTITEDAETSLRLHAQGYNSAYIDHPMISGLQPETYADFLIQRLRWAQGMVQIFVLKNPLFNRGLKVWQRLGYLSCSFFWFFGYARVIFLLAPAAYLMFGLRVYDANLREFLAFTVPHLIASMVVADYLFGRVRWAFVSELYEIMQSLFSLPTVFRVLLNPHAPKFMVTPKGDQIGKDFVSELSGPFYLIYLVTLVALAFGAFRYVTYPDERDTLYITMGWELLNLILLNAAMGALLESKQRRVSPRIDADLTGQLLFEGHPPIDCRVDDLSDNGAQLVVDKAALAPSSRSSGADVLVYNVALGKMSRLHLTIANARELEDGTVVLGTAFAHRSPQEKSEAVALAHGDSERWLRFLQRRDKRQGILKSFVAMLMLGTKYAAVHFALILEIGIDVLADTFDRIAQRVRPDRRGRDRRDRRMGVSVLAEVVTRLERRVAKVRE
jgi:cellulose synthase (UDP-forming)